MKAFAFVIFATVALGYSIVQAQGTSKCTNDCNGYLGEVITMINDGTNEAKIIRHIDVRGHIVIVLSSTLWFLLKPFSKILGVYLNLIQRTGFISLKKADFKLQLQLTISLECSNSWWNLIIDIYDEVIKGNFITNKSRVLYRISDVSTFQQNMWIGFSKESEWSLNSTKNKLNFLKFIELHTFFQRFYGGLHKKHNFDNATEFYNFVDEQKDNNGFPGVFCEIECSIGK